MAILLHLRTDDAAQLAVTLDGAPLGDATSLADLPNPRVLQATPYIEGRALTQALRGEPVPAVPAAYVAHS